jgi:hypothetical protein
MAHIVIPNIFRQTGTSNITVYNSERPTEVFYGTTLSVTKTGSPDRYSEYGTERCRMLFLYQNVQTDFGGHQVSYSVGTKILSRQVKRPEVLRTEVKNGWSHNFLRLCLNDVNRDNFTLY